MIIYLSDVVEGGETVFPNSTMQPVRNCTEEKFSEKQMIRLWYEYGH